MGPFNMDRAFIIVSPKVENLKLKPFHDDRENLPDIYLYRLRLLDIMWYLVYLGLGLPVRNRITIFVINSTYTEQNNRSL